ncbi:DUF488 domain-containing protein [Pseudidiomarina donghaiensis]|uniref:DUF488 domain-containing protein n=1 Tax=Pseudidiomarina donghaiensis TaxID=519452 RepID=UPI003A970B52
MQKNYTVLFKRAYDKACAEDGQRILADRLWPRGIKKDDLKLNDWCKECCPSNQLRKDYHAQKLDFESFAHAYFKELESNPEVLIPLMKAARKDKVTLISAVKAFEYSHLPVLKHALIKALAQEDNEADGDTLSSPVCFGNDFNYWG